MNKLLSKFKSAFRRQGQAWVGLVISGVALVLAVRGIHLREVMDALRQAEYAYFVLAALGLLAYLWARSVRWRILLQYGGASIGLERVFWITNIGYLVSNVFPFRLGDPARAVIVGRDRGITIPAALSTVVIERVLDMLMVVAILMGITPFIGGVGNARLAGGVAGGVALCALALMLVLAFRPEWGQTLLRWVLERIPGLEETSRERWAESLDGLFAGLAALRSGRRSVGLAVWTVITWACVVAFYGALIRAFLPHPPLLAAPFLVCVVGLGMALPSSPGAMGVFQVVARYGLSIPFDIPDGQAVTIAFGVYAFQYILGCLLGIVGLGRESLSLTWLRTQAADVSTNVEKMDLEEEE